MIATKIVQRLLLESQLLTNLKSACVVWTPEVREEILRRVELRRINRQSTETHSNKHD